MNNNIELHIEELILHGIAPGDTFRIGQAVQAELTRLLQMHGLPESLSAEAEFGDLSVGQFNVAENARPNAVGNQIAGSVFKGLQRTQVG